MREEMKVGDLVKIDVGRDKGSIGVVTDFDNDNDPIVCWHDLESKSGVFYHYHVEVINEAN
jgi:transcription elongation factor